MMDYCGEKISKGKNGRFLRGLRLVRLRGGCDSDVPKKYNLSIIFTGEEDKP